MKLKKLLAASVAAFTIALAGAANASSVKVALDSPPSMEKSGTYIWAHTFAEHLKKNGMEAEEFERGALGGEAERLDQVSQGLLEVSMSALKSAGQLDGTIFGLMMPYFFKDSAEADMALSKGGMLAKINEVTTKKGVRVMDVVYVGPPAGIFNTKKPVKSVKDMADLRMRALDEAQIEVFKSWGSQGTVVSWAEVPNALQTGVADGYLNPSFVPLLFGHTGFIKHFTDASISPSSRVALVSEDWYQGLSDAEKKTVNDAAATAHAANRKWVAGQDGVLKALEKAGIKVVKLDEKARAEFREKSMATYEKMPMPEGALEQWKKAVGR